MSDNALTPVAPNGSTLTSYTAEDNAAAPTSTAEVRSFDPSLYESGEEYGMTSAAGGEEIVRQSEPAIDPDVHAPIAGEEEAPPALTLGAGKDPVLKAAPDGTGIIGPSDQVEGRVRQLEFEHKLHVIDNIRGGLGGTVGHALWGERGAEYGAAVDKLAKAGAKTVEGLQANRSISQAAPHPQTTTQ